MKKKTNKNDITKKAHNTITKIQLKLKWKLKSLFNLKLHKYINNARITP